MTDDFDDIYGLEDAKPERWLGVPESLWQDISSFFANAVYQCKDCYKGNLHTCWRGNCPVFPFRDLARRIRELPGGEAEVELRLPNHVKVENEILAILAKNGAPMYPSCIVLASTSSKANKHTAINRLVRDGRVVETRVNGYTRMISLPNNKEPENENTEPTNDNDGATRRNPARELGAGPSDARRNHRAE